MVWIFATITAILAYLLGSVNSSIIISKIISGKDIRESGSGNAGATNMLRTHGKKAGVMTLIGDMLKGVIAILMAMFLVFILNLFLVPKDYLTSASMLTPTIFGVAVSDFELKYILPAFSYIAGLFAVIGHNFPVFFGFKGGKGIATSGAVLLMLDWKIGLIVTAIAILVMAITRYVSLGSVIAAIAYPFILLGFMVGQGNFVLSYLIFAVLLATICTLRHKANITRLLNGEESKLGQKKANKGGDIQ